LIKGTRRKNYSWISREQEGRIYFPWLKGTRRKYMYACRSPFHNETFDKCIRIYLIRLQTRKYSFIISSYVSMQHQDLTPPFLAMLEWPNERIRTPDTWRLNEEEIRITRKRYAPKSPLTENTKFVNKTWDIWLAKVPSRD
jgi:hypothetical protein